MTAIERFFYFLENQGLKHTPVEKELGLSNGYLRKMERRNASIGSDVVEKIVSYFPALSTDWLITGKGEMLTESSNEKNDIPIAIPATGGGIPLIPIEAMAGFGKGESTVLEYECEQYVIPIFQDAEFLIQVKGSSMYPKYSSGDVVACKKLPMTDIFFQWNKVYVLDTAQGALIKRIKKGSKNNHILVVSENPNYDPFELKLDQVFSVAIVIGVIRLE